MQQRRQRPKLGQNFLVSPTAQAAIADALGDVSQRTVIEIGPGRGALTSILARRAQHLIAIELDRDLTPRLRSEFAGHANVEILQQDVLAVDFAHLHPPDISQGEETGGPQKKLFVVGNLPYYITSDILLHLFRFHANVERAVLMVQREVADRVAAQPGTRDYGLLSATTQTYARVENLFTLPPEAFSPSPQVHSTVLRLTMARRFEELQVAPEEFFAFLRICFAQKRKMLQKNLRTAGHAPQAISAAFARCNIDPKSRAEELDLSAMACLFRQL